jgi:hypothetical protein
MPEMTLLTARCFLLSDRRDWRGAHLRWLSPRLYSDRIRSLIRR